MTVAAALAATSPWAHSAFAADATEATYGRIAGDVGIAVGAGAVAAHRFRAEGEVRLRYLDTAGVFVTYEDGFGDASASEATRLLAAGLELRPFFLFRWLRGFEVHRAWFDLAVDSLGLELGAWTSLVQDGALQSAQGLQAGVGLELPIEPAASGPWIGLHGGIRWGARALTIGRFDDEGDRSVYLAVTLAWHQIVAAHVVDLGDRAPQ